MPAGDGAVRTVSNATCNNCGAGLKGDLTVQVDQWCTFACHTCESNGDVDAPSLCAVYSLPRAEDAE